MFGPLVEARTINCLLDTEQTKEHSDNLIAAMNELIDGLLRIGNELYEKAA